MNVVPPPLWQAHEAPGYDEAMAQHSKTLLQKIKTDPAYRAEIRTDPRILHQTLFQQFTPIGYPEYAGTYRGTPNTSLVERVSVTNSALRDGEVYNFFPPNEVGLRMTTLSNTVAQYIVEAKTDQHRKVALAFQFSWFGRIHPFLDGNGHVQRTLFAALATEFGYSLSTRFSIHPRPFDRLFAIALELFTRATETEANKQLGLVSEYLEFFIE